MMPKIGTDSLDLKKIIYKLINLTNNYQVSHLIETENSNEDPFVKSNKINK